MGVFKNNGQRSSKYTCACEVVAGQVSAQANIYYFVLMAFNKAHIKAPVQRAQHVKLSALFCFFCKQDGILDIDSSIFTMDICILAK